MLLPPSPPRSVSFPGNLTPALGASGPHDFAVRIARSSRPRAQNTVAATPRPPHPAPNVSRRNQKRSLLGAQDGRDYTGDLRGDQAYFLKIANGANLTSFRIWLWTVGRHRRAAAESGCVKSLGSDSRPRCARAYKALEFVERPFILATHARTHHHSREPGRQVRYFESQHLPRPIANLPVQRQHIVDACP